MIFLPKQYYLVVGDRFELFYRGVIKSFNPYKFYIKAECEKGYTYNRYFTFTPTQDEVGNYPLSINVYDDDGNIMETASTTLIVNEIEKPKRRLNVLCIGDSETVNGVWPYVGYKKFEDKYPNLLNFIGIMKKEEIGYEGYGGWQWKTFCGYETESRTSHLVVKTKYKVESKYINKEFLSNDLSFIVTNIDQNIVKFKRGKNNTSTVNPKIGTSLRAVEDNFTIEVESYEYCDANPFWNNETQKLDFKKYIKDNNFEEPDLIFTFLTGNGLYIPYDEEFPNHQVYGDLFLKSLHEDFPKALFGIMGIEVPCVNGGVTACYGASGYYNDWYGYMVSVLNYDKWLEQYVNTELKGISLYTDIKSQFDSEHNYPYEMVKVNNRSDTTERIGTNGLHPSIDGYKQIGDAFFRFLVQMVKNKNKTL